MPAQKDLEILYKAVNKHWPYEEPHIEYSTDGYLYFRQKGSLLAIPFPIESLMSERSKSLMPKESYIITEEIESFFREYMVILVAQVNTEDKDVVKKEEKESYILPPDVEKEALDKFVYPEGVTKAMAEKRKRELDAD